jgi:iron-sulfur cluster assembly protein
MLTFTDTATVTIEALTSEPDMPDTKGLRISSNTENSNGPTLAVALTQAPAPDDQVIELPHAKVYLEPEAADMLSDKVLDANISEDGSVSFRIAPQAASPA